MAAFPIAIGGLSDAMHGRVAILCDVWGVVHNGVVHDVAAATALARQRETSAAVILLTNAPRPAAQVIAQLDRLGVPRAAYDRVITSGDVARDLVSHGPRRVFHLGPERDLPLFDGLDVELVEHNEAQAVVCTGLFDDETETPRDYAEMLAFFRSRDLEMLCANPDLVVERGNRRIFCAGALARDYSQLGGRTRIAGKPHGPVYDLAVAMASRIAGRPLARSEFIAIGDGVLTDIKGAHAAGIDTIYISSGIHAHEYGERTNPDIAAMREFLEKHGTLPRFTMTSLR
jgi:HAD superfamily hydrolase (TIGR01450 family)